jgi:hypothetical protein
MLTSLNAEIKVATMSPINPARPRPATIALRLTWPHAVSSIRKAVTAHRIPPRQPCPRGKEISTRITQLSDNAGATDEHRTNVMEKHFTRVDVTGEFPFLVTKMSPYDDR